MEDAVACVRQWGALGIVLVAGSCSWAARFLRVDLEPWYVTDGVAVEDSRVELYRSCESPVSVAGDSVKWIAGCWLHAGRWLFVLG